MMSGHDGSIGRPPDRDMDEEFARLLLEAHLTSQGETGFSCEINRNDPPDLVARLGNGEQWGVEVVRAYQQVEQIGHDEAGSSETVRARLSAFAGKLEHQTEAIRRRGYVLYLEGPGPLSSWNGAVSTPRWTRWERETTQAVRDHVVRGDGDTLRFPGGSLQPREPGCRWTFMLGATAAELCSATTAILRRVLDDKANGLCRWSGTFAQRWLLVLSCYPLADDNAAIETTLRRLVRETATVSGYDGVYWSGYPDRALVPISLSDDD